MARRSAEKLEKVDRGSLLRNSIIVLSILGGIAAAVDSIINSETSDSPARLEQPNSVQSNDRVENCINLCISLITDRARQDLFESCHSNCSYTYSERKPYVTY